MLTTTVLTGERRLPDLARCLNPQNHVGYNIAVETPQYDLTSLQDLENFPIAINGSGRAPQVLGNLATVARRRARHREPL